MGVVLAGTNIFVDAAMEETGEHTNEITEYPIEDGSKIHSHAHLLPRTVTVDGILAGDDYRSKFDILRTLRDERMIIAYSGRMFYDSMVVKELSETYNAGIKNGLSVRIVFQQVTIVGGAGGGAVGVGGAGPGAVAADPANSLIEHLMRTGRYRVPGVGLVPWSGGGAE